MPPPLPEWMAGLLQEMNDASRETPAWLDLIERSIASASDVTPFVADLVWLEDVLDRTFPKACAFVRPGFDEPRIACLPASEGQPYP